MSPSEGRQARVLKVPESADGERVDRFLAGRLDDESRTSIQRSVDSGRVRVNGDAARRSLRVRTGDRIEFTPLPPPPSELVPEAIPLDVLYEDEHLAAIAKPAGMTVHPGAGVSRGTVANAVAHRYGELSTVGGDERPGIVHRLDRDTTGVLLVARNDTVHRRLSEAFQRREVRKEYRLLVLGSPQHTTGVVELPLGRDRRHRTRMAVRRDDGKPALTTWRVLERLPVVTYVSCSPQTGRTHQIRVHMQAIRHPILGDPIYGVRPGAGAVAPAVESALAEFTGMALHAYRLALRHPVTGDELELHAPLPEAFERLLDGLRAVGAP